jgi:carbon starvation protein
VYPLADGTRRLIRGSSWGVFTIACTVPIALFVGLWMYKIRKGKVVEASLIGAVAVLACTWLGSLIPGSPLEHLFSLSKNQVTVAIAAYGFIASVLPVWLLLCPRDYLSSFMKIGAMLVLAAGVIVVNPVLRMPAVTAYAAGGGPVIPGPLFPFVFITIMCGAISGFHSLIASGTTPKMVERERDILPIAYGAMLLEGFVGVIALVAATALHPADYFAINTSPAVFAKLGMTPVNLAHLSEQVGETLAGRPGGAVSLAVGMAQIFSSLPFLGGFMSFWYHFVIMFEAMFVMTLIDTGTRVTRYMFQEVGSMVVPGLKGWTGFAPAALFSALSVLAWGYFVWTGTITTLWPLVGVSNQLLAAIALAIGTSWLFNTGRGRYAWTTLAPLAFMCVNTLTAGWMNLRVNYLRVQFAEGAPDLATAFARAPMPARAQCVVTAVVMVLMVAITTDCVWRWVSRSRAAEPDAPAPAAAS